MTTIMKTPMKRMRPLGIVLAAGAFAGAFALGACTDADAGMDIETTAALLVGADGAANPGRHCDTEDGPSLEVKTHAGRVLGKLVGQTAEFLGIPYAKPPVGELRFAPPQPAEPWDSVLDAVEFGSACPQLPSPIFPIPGDEDCLTLNVFKPETAKKGDRLPVMVYIHGGAFVGGSAMDMQALSEAGNVVGVSMNYRLGALGFLSHPVLDDARRRHVPSGNDGLRDQQLALRWVKQNIRAFGGDPHNVTVFGESAGSMSTCLQMVSPTAKRLADRFIMESAVCMGILPGGFPVYSKAEAQSIGAALVDDLCAGQSDIMACLRSLPAETLTTWGTSLGMFGAGWGPSYNPIDRFLPEAPWDLIAEGRYNPGEIVVGTNKNEWGIFMPAPISGIDEFNAVVEMEFGPLADAIKAHYTVESDAEADAVYIRLITDRTFRCPTRTFVRAVAAQGSTAYLYHFEELPAWHTFELPYIFGPQPGYPPNIPSLQTAMQGSWSAFAYTGDPNMDALPEWPPYNEADDMHMIFKAESETGTGLAADDCDFWDNLL